MRRPAYFALLLVTICLGLASRHWAPSLPNFIGAYAGDALWASAVYWVLALAHPRMRAAHRLLLALAIAITVEVSQLFHPAWLEAVRATWFGARVLGFGFLWSDLVCYAVGVALAVMVDLRFGRVNAVDINGGRE